MSVFAKICSGLLISTLSLTAYAAGPEEQTPGQQPVEEGIVVDVTNATEVIQALYIGNEAEVQIADLVRERNPDESMQRFADTLARDHSWMNKMLEAIANIKSVSLKAEELSEVAQKLEAQLETEAQSLAARPAEEFRSAVLEAIIAEHEKTLELYNQIEQGSSDDALKATVAIFRQLVESHLAEAHQLQLAAEEPTQPGVE